ncbi:MAG: hypothetical protein XXXJIFNMEKO3_01347 [Candidatus Erwinia impunctatus]|nr:hypothetical protein XXXJIFNMEKO_01347 [Culicoides impunctatus]
MNCFYPALLAGILLLTGCTGQQQKPPEAEFFAGNSPLTITHIITRADDGSSIRVTVDGYDAGLLKRGEHTTLHLPAGKHIVGGYVETLLGYGRVTIPPLTVTTQKQTIRQVEYSIRLNKPAFSDRGTTQDPAAETTTPVATGDTHNQSPTATSPDNAVSPEASLPSVTVLPVKPPSITVQPPENTTVSDNTAVSDNLSSATPVAESSTPHAATAETPSAATPPAATSQQ